MIRYMSLRHEGKPLELMDVLDDEQSNRDSSKDVIMGNSYPNSAACLENTAKTSEQAPILPFSSPTLANKIQFSEIP
ncbi:hypothetical protein AC578_6389 [Pseudocercospora eumusae]|uniref:Uncharacterized protein n=1 Tax=Pseudocercospora eumusae TaxID=321146 RepID=A0A139H0W2_9PEZI|nr:hypothetical protein AC578_6389 [Pseudocercospora eumusae]